MIINIELAQELRRVITLIMVYFPSVILSGYFQTIIASKMGDNTAKNMGFLSLNPILYFDLLGFIILFVAGYGWGRAVPVNPLNIREPRRNLKLGAIFFSRPLAHLCILIIFGLLFLLLTTHSGGHSSSLLLSMIFILRAFFSFNMAMFGLTLIYSLVCFIFLLYTGDPLARSRYAFQIAIATIVALVAIASFGPFIL